METDNIDEQEKLKRQFVIGLVGYRLGKKDGKFDFETFKNNTSNLSEENKNKIERVANLLLEDMDILEKCLKEHNYKIDEHSALTFHKKISEHRGEHFQPTIARTDFEGYAIKGFKKFDGEEDLNTKMWLLREKLRLKGDLVVGLNLRSLIHEFDKQYYGPASTKLREDTWQLISTHEFKNRLEKMKDKESGEFYMIRIIEPDEIGQKYTEQFTEKELEKYPIVKSVIDKQIGDINDKYMFSWDDVPGSDSERLVDYLVKDLKIEWAKDAEIKKTDNGKTITIVKDDKSLKLELNEKEDKVILKISGGETHEYISKKENGKLNIYTENKAYLMDEVLRAYIKVKNEPIEEIKKIVVENIESEINSFLHVNWVCSGGRLTESILYETIEYLQQTRKEKPYRIKIVKRDFKDKDKEPMVVLNAWRTKKNVAMLLTNKYKEKYEEIFFEEKQQAKEEIKKEKKYLRMMWAAYGGKRKDFEIKTKDNNPVDKTNFEIKTNANEYLFSWDKIPGNDNEKLIDFLKQNFGIDWVKPENVKKIDENTIIISDEKNNLSLELNNEKTEVSLKIDDDKTDKFIAKMENGELNIYDDGPVDKTIIRIYASGLIIFEREIDWKFSAEAWSREIEKTFFEEFLRRDFDLFYEDIRTGGGDNIKISLSPQHALIDFEFGFPSTVIRSKFVPEITTRLVDHFVTSVRINLQESINRHFSIMYQFIEERNSGKNILISRETITTDDVCNELEEYMGIYSIITRIKGIYQTMGVFVQLMIETTGQKTQEIEKLDNYLKTMVNNVDVFKEMINEKREKLIYLSIPKIKDPQDKITVSNFLK